VFLLPDQSPLAVHSDASVEVQLMVVDSPLVMLSGLADRETVGAGAETVTLTESASEQADNIKTRNRLKKILNKVEIFIRAIPSQLMLS
jgi:hypothetical protein